MPTTNQLQKKIEELQAEIYRLHSIIENLPGSIYWKDKKGVYLGQNAHAARRMQEVGLDPNRIGRTDYEIFPKEAAAQYRKSDLMVIDSAKEYTTEETLTLPNGEVISQLSIKKPLRDKDGNIEGVIGNTTDITALKKVENELRVAKDKAEASDKAKSEFLDNMRHDIRTPASGIVGFSHIIKQEAKEKNVKEYADNLIASGNALLNFLDEILDAISISTGDVPLLKKKFDLKEEAIKIIDLNLAKAKEKKLEFSLSYDDRIPKYLLGDPKRVQRILLELVSNALKFTQQGHVKVLIALDQSNGREKVIKLEVEDTGIGIPEEKKEEVFLRFNRLTPSYQGIYRGAGLGLSIVKKFMDELHGEIKVKSGKEGSTFTCLIPLEESLSGEEAESTTQQEATIHPIPTTKKTKEESPTQSQKVITKSKILVVEDDAISADIAQMVLELLDCDVDIAVNGEAAIKLFQEKAYDLIFMDIGLPDMDGYKVTQRIRALEWKSEHHIPIIALSAHATTEHKQACIEKGMTAVLIKPLVENKAADILNAFIPSRIKKEVPSTPQPKETSQDELFVITGPVIDLDIAAQIGLPQKTIEEKIFPLLLKSVPEDISQLQKAYQKGDWKGVEELAHKLKGGSGTCGAVRMKEACSRLEAYLMEGEGEAEIRKQLYELALKEAEAAKKGVEEILAKTTEKKKKKTAQKKAA